MLTIDRKSAISSCMWIDKLLNRTPPKRDHTVRRSVCVFRLGCTMRPAYCLSGGVCVRELNTNTHTETHTLEPIITGRSYSANGSTNAYNVCMSMWFRPDIVDYKMNTFITAAPLSAQIMILHDINRNSCIHPFSYYSCVSFSHTHTHTFSCSRSLSRASMRPLQWMIRDVIMPMIIKVTIQYAICIWVHREFYQLTRSLCRRTVAYHCHGVWQNSARIANNKLIIRRIVC